MTPAVGNAGEPVRRQSALAPVLALVFGLAAIVGAVGGNVNDRRQQEHDITSLRQLRHSLDSARATLATMTTAADSARLAEQLRESEEGISYRAFHVPSQQDSLDRWWTVTGPGTIAVAVGVVLIGAGLFGLRQRAATRRD